jgi:hypothetical protein
VTATKLTTLAHVIRSKNAGPTQLTIDIFFRDIMCYRLAVASSALSCVEVAELYQLPAEAVTRYELVDILALKFSMPRRVCAGDPGDGDVYGAQQHAPLLEVLV